MKTQFKQDEHDDDTGNDVHHVLVEENIDGVRVVSVRTVVKCKLLDQKKDHCDHKLSEGTVMVVTIIWDKGDLDCNIFLFQRMWKKLGEFMKMDEIGTNNKWMIAHVPKNGRQGC